MSTQLSGRVFAIVAVSVGLLGCFPTNVPYTVRLAQDAGELDAELGWHGIAAEHPDWDPMAK